jgi:hypothetical protein
MYFVLFQKKPDSLNPVRPEKSSLNPAIYAKSYGNLKLILHPRGKNIVFLILSVASQIG